MNERTIEKALDFQASPERVWKAITEPAELSMWFGHRTDLDLRPGGDGGTTLHLRESGFLTDLHRQQNTGGWDAELGELVDLLGTS